MAVLKKIGQKEAFLGLSSGERAAPECRLIGLSGLQRFQMPPGPSSKRNIIIKAKAVEAGVFRLRRKQQFAGEFCERSTFFLELGPFIA